MRGTMTAMVVAVRSRALAATIVGLILAVVAAPAASAHTDLTSSTPAEGATVGQLDEVSLTFTSTLLDIGAELSLVDAEGTTTALEPTFPAPDTVAAAVDTDLAAGAAQLVWRVVAEDGHPLEGVVDFTVASDDSSATPEPTSDASVTPAVTPSPAGVPTDDASATATPTAAPADASATPSPSPSATATDDDPAIPAWGWVLIAIVVLGSAATAVAIAARRRPGADDPTA